MFDQLGDSRHAGRVQPGDDVVVVHQQCRSLVAQAGAGGGRDAELVVGADLARFDAQASAQVGHQGNAAQHAVGDVVAEQQAVTADRLGVQKAVEAGHATHLGQGQAQRLRYLAQGAGGQPAEFGLKLTQDLNELMGLVMVPCECAVRGA